MDVIHALGYSMLIASNTAELEEMYREYHQHVQIVLWEDSPWHSRPCLRNSTCVYIDAESRNSVPPPNSTHLNIPIWKIFNCNWWETANPPLGGPFTLSPENYPIWPGGSGGRANHFIGYSIEKTCLKTPFIPHHERPRQAYVFAKYLRYFLRPEYFLPSNTGDTLSQTRTNFFSGLSTSANLTFVGQFKREETPPTVFPPAGIQEIPRMERVAFQKVVASSRVLMGIGVPGLSPTPYEALCLGVPFINPVEEWDTRDPEDLTKWRSQHDGLLHSGVKEPYVYHVKAGDREGFEKAIVKAMETPISRYIPKDMKMSALVRRIKMLLETDWKPVASERMQEVGFKLDA
ncbi:hypothetical protein FRB90_010052 [Tulasnella sp. 427]|nr:hypothetical protein FRB90_010052 [Tulasnella sp. 427]